MVAERHLQDLYDQLIAPVRERLTKPHLIIAPHRFLHQLPFHALHDGTRFLVDDFSVSYIPSASIFHLCSQRTGQFHDASLIVGVPDPRTPFIEEEARAVAKLLPNPRLCLGGDATDSVIREFGPVSRFIHIAAHGLFRADNPMFSSLRLGDCYLSLFDLYTLPLSAELVSLSGCSTGLNVVVGGDEIFGLMRGLFAAGTQSVLVSLWDVNDPSTAELMRAFYSHLRLTRDKSKALRSAMLETRERHPHPYYWAPFILAGNYMNQSRLKIP